MYTFINYVTAFWSVVVMNCIQPVNWQYCYRVDEWLLPEVNQGIEIYLDKNHNHLYREEKKYLDNVVE